MIEKADMYSLLEGMPHPAALIDRDLRIVAVNGAMEALTGFSHEQAAGIPHRYIIRDSLCLRECPAEQVLKYGKRYGSEADIINREREKAPVYITASPLLDKKGNLIGVLQTVEDISLLREMEGHGPMLGEYPELVGHSGAMRKTLEILPVVAQTDSSVLITGETGAGKDLVAWVIHRNSPRAQGPFVKVNCGALPENLLESELFGHVKGAFTGAVRDKPGRFQLAEGGAIYLTEIGDLQLPLQVKLLSVLDDREITPVGGTRTIKTDVRVIAATHRDLESMVAEGTFRQDLLYRLKVMRLDLPPLRERNDDIRLLLEHFLLQFSEKLGKEVTGFTSRALEILGQYSYPGNVRELRNIVEYAASVCPGGKIGPAHLPAYLMSYMKGEASSPSRVESRPAPASSQAQTPKPSAASEMMEPGMDWEEMERRMIADALVKSSGNRTRAAESLGWGRATLWRKMKKHGLLK